MTDILIRIAADWTMIPIVLIGAYALLIKVPKKGRLEAYARIVVAGLTAYLFAKLIASFFQPEILRPFEQAGKAPGASYLNNPGFPSDHILLTTAITLAVWFETRQKYLTWALIVLVVITAIGRVAAGVHTPLDVVGGAIIASIGSLWYYNK